ncbi:hypothetical protein [Streptomyces sp. V1I6]|uniref:hypothetical protein n=1 Tax=Streptomyces sp. V1I6 TaxID=3042273 RepID=UPI002789178E|nr:hypothetical protein [Streptomyces sp. V1I6]MDQ0847582.1 hypothetical protein [Streptomyces sp. V1I6]
MTFTDITPLHSRAELQVIAADHQRSAERQSTYAAHLADAGREGAAGTWERAARESRRLATAARHGWPHYEIALLQR